MNEITVVIVEDEFIIAEDVKLRLESAGYHVLATFDSGEAALPFILSQKPDLLIADIRLLGNMNGIELVEKVLAQCKLPVIYITANSDRATFQQAKRTHPHAFLVKPFATENLLSAVDLALDNFSWDKSPDQIDPEIPPPAREENQFVANDYLFIRTNGKYQKVAVNEILFIQALGSYLDVVAEKCTYRLSYNLSDFSRKVNLPNLLRVHRSFIINLNRIESFSETFLFLKESKIPIGRSYRSSFFKRMNYI